MAGFPLSLFRLLVVVIFIGRLEGYQSAPVSDKTHFLPPSKDLRKGPMESGANMMITVAFMTCSVKGELNIKIAR